MPSTAEGRKKVKRRSPQQKKVTVNSKEGQKKVPKTEEGQKNVKRRSKEGPDNRRMSE